MLEQLIEEMKKVLFAPLINAVYDAMKIGAEHLTMSRRLIELLADKYNDPELLEDYDKEFTKTVDAYYDMFAAMDLETLQAYMKEKAESNRKE